MHSQRLRITSRDALIAGSARRADCLGIIEAGLEAADPAGFMRKVVSGDAITSPDGRTVTRLGPYSAIYTVAIGKAAGSMAHALRSILGSRLAGGLVILPKGSRSPLRSKRFRTMSAQHPVPDHSSVRAAKEAVKFLQARRDGELVIFLISGGGSSLLALPDGITLGEKIHVTEMLLRSGADIGEFNCVRRCLSQVKGGRLAGHLKCDGIGLLMSDVQGDDPATIASGPTHMVDESETECMYGRALGILDKYNLRKKAGIQVIRHLRAMEQERTNSKNGNCNFQNRMIANHIIATNADCLEAMRRSAVARGYVMHDASPICVFSDIKNAASAIYDAVPDEPGMCVIFGGEPTVRVLGDGRGGRNQELVLRLLKKMQKRHSGGGGSAKKITVASVGTDGRDGNSIYAGAIADSERADILSINDALKNSDSTGFLERRRKSEGGSVLPPSCIRTGPTHTNLMDIGVMLT